MNDESDPKVSAAYRELGAEEPPRALDDAVLAAARREAGARPGLRGRSGPNRWYAPVAAAAVLMLAVAVTLHMQVEQPDIASPVAKAPLPVAQKEVAKEAAKPAAVEKEAPARHKSAEQPAPPAATAPAVAAAPEPTPFVADQPVASARSDDSRGAAASGTGTLAEKFEERSSRDAQAAARAPQAGPVQALAKRADRAESAEAQANLQALKQSDTPERELERIAGLRGQGRHEEADKALAEFRKRHPEFRISEEMRARVERR